MNSDTITKLLTLNRQFYQTFSRSFSATRQQLQPGVRRILDTIRRDAKILDLGCGNGKLAYELLQNTPTQLYVGVDSNTDLLTEAEFSLRGKTIQPAFFFQADLSAPDWDSELINSFRIKRSASQQADRCAEADILFDIGLAFAVLHHLPGEALRTKVLEKVNKLLDPVGGYFVLSVWQFLNSPRLVGRIQPWELINLKSSDVDEGDYLLDWRQGGNGLRYVHHFTPIELAQLAQKTGFSIQESFLSDGDNNQLGLYQVWCRKQ